MPIRRVDGSASASYGVEVEQGDLNPQSACAAAPSKSAACAVSPLLQKWERPGAEGYQPGAPGLLISSW